VQLEIVAAVGCFFRCPAVYRQIAFEGVNVLFFFRVGLYRRNERQSDGSLPNSHFKRQRKVHVHGLGVSMCKTRWALGKAGAKSIGLLRAPDKPECSLSIPTGVPPTQHSRTAFPPHQVRAFVVSSPWLFSSALCSLLFFCEVDFIASDRYVCWAVGGEQCSEFALLNV
jgi:hypothetical protein